MLDTKAKYKAVQQQNGKYKIIGLPIFETYKDETRKEAKEVTVAELKEIVRVFETMKREKGYFPRVQVGHHDDSTKNNPHAGYLDNLRVQGNIIFADIVEMPSDIFNKVQNDFYPYRSVEFNPSSKTIDNLALLQSRASYFKFPITRVELEKFQKNNGLCYQFVFPKMELFMNKYEYQDDQEQMADPEETEQMGSEEEQEQMADPEETEKMADEDDQEQMADPEETEKMANDGGGDMAEIKAMLKQLISIVGGGGKATGSSPAKGVSSSSVAMQSKRSTIYQEMHALKLEVKDLREERENDDILARLYAVCETNTSLNFQQERAHILSLKGRENKLAHITYVSNLKKVRNQHSATQFAASKSAALENKAIKYTADGTEKGLVKKLVQSYQVHSTGSGKERFTESWKTEEDYVKFFLEQERENPGYCQKQLFN